MIARSTRAHGRRPRYERASMRSASCILVAALASCAALAPSHRFSVIDHLRTTVPRHLAEGGHAAVVATPPGVAFTARLDGYEEEPLARVPERRFELEVVVVDQGAVPGVEGPHPRLDDAELVDDRGHVFRCRRARVPDRAAPDARRGAVPTTHTYTLVFELPVAYRFRAVSRVVVHWVLVLADGAELHVTSRFRRD